MRRKNLLFVAVKLDLSEFHIFDRFDDLGLLSAMTGTEWALPRIRYHLYYKKEKSYVYEGYKVFITQKGLRTNKDNQHKED